MDSTILIKGDGLLPSKIEGNVVAITESGNLVTDIAADRLRAAPRDARTTVFCDEHMTSGIFGTDHQEPAMTFLALIGDTNCLELSIVGDSAAMMLGIRKGEKVIVSW